MTIVERSARLAAITLIATLVIGAVAAWPINGMLRFEHASTVWLAFVLLATLQLHPVAVDGSKGCAVTCSHALGPTPVMHELYALAFT
jgi:hypothetical protein